MLRKRMSVLLNGVALGACTACGGGSTSSVGDHVDAAVITTDASTEPQTFAYVLRVVDVGKQDASGRLDGFNLDGLVSDANDAMTCYQRDGLGVDGSQGIDNALARLAASLPVGDVQASIDDGSFLVLLNVSDVNDFLNDAHVEVSLYFGQSNAAELTFDDSGLLAPGQSFDIKSSSVMNGDKALSLVKFTGALANGTFTSEGDTLLTLALPLLGQSQSLHLDYGRMSFAFTPDKVTGLMGGGIDVDELVSILVSEQVLPLQEGEIRTLLSGYADLHAELETPEAEPVCHGMSAALTFEGVPCTLGNVVEVPATDL